MKAESILAETLDGIYEEIKQRGFEITKRQVLEALATQLLSLHSASVQSSFPCSLITDSFQINERRELISGDDLFLRLQAQHMRRMEKAKEVKGDIEAQIAHLESKDIDDGKLN